MSDYINCFACGAKSLNIEGEIHDYLLSAPGCYEMFKEVLEKEYSDFSYAKAHHYTVDAYACQHPGDNASNPKAISSLGIHLVSLHMLFEKEMKLSRAADVKMEFAKFNKEHGIVKPLEKPSKLGNLTIYQVWDNESAELHFKLCQNWALSTWKAWSSQHAIIETWVNEFLEKAQFDF